MSDRPKAVLEIDELGTIWLEIQGAPQVEHESQPRDALVIKAPLPGAPVEGHQVKVGLRMPRTQGYLLRQKISDALEKAISQGAEGVTSTLRVARVVNGGAQRQTGHIALYFQGQSGLTHRIEMPPDQSGPLIDFVKLAAQAAAAVAEERSAGAHGGTDSVESSPIDTKSVQMYADPASGREFLKIKLPNGLQYSFLLTEQDARALRPAPKSRSPVSHKKRPPNRTN